MRVSSLLVAFLVLLLAVAISATGSQLRLSRSHSSRLIDFFRGVSRTPLYTRTAPPPGWTLNSQAAPSTPLTFTLVVEGSNAARLEELFWQVSDPDHPSYGKHLSNAEVEALVAPQPSDLAALYSALVLHGIAAADVTSHGDSFTVSTTVEAASSFFATAFHTFTHSKTGVTAVRQMGDCSLPATLTGTAAVRLVLGVHTFPTIEQRLRMASERRARQSALKASAAAAPITPAWVPKAVSKIYGVPYPIAPASTASVQAGVIEWVGEVFSAKDLANFSRNVEVPLTPVDRHRIIGNNTEEPYPGIEASLDIQWIEGINPGFTPWFWIVSNPALWMYEFTVEFLTATDYPSIISLSYGLPELDQCDFFPKGDCYGLDYATYIRVVDRQFMKIGLIGVSVIVCSQDRGVYVSSPSPSDPDAPIAPFTPEYPGTSPYITSVGATEYGSPEFDLPSPPPACNSTHWQCISGGAQEQAVSYNQSGYLSGGGFSNVDVAPAYQTAAIAAYLNSGVQLPNATVWNKTGRGFPDVSAIGMNGYIVDNGNPGLVSGTSMSTPIIAAIIALVQNDYYSMTNMTLGFLNTLLYKGQASGAGLFKDITVGDNCRTSSCAVQDGFLTAKGWDPVTGLGSPMYPKMKAYVQQVAEKVLARRSATAAGDAQ